MIIERIQHFRSFSSAPADSEGNFFFKRIEIRSKTVSVTIFRIMGDR